MAQLRVTSPNLKGAVFVLDGEFFTIGREPDNHIQLDHTSVSKHHALLKADGDAPELFDLHSTNGVIVNGERRAVAPLRDGDRIVLGEVELRFEADRQLAQGQAPAPFPANLSRPAPTSVSALPTTAVSRHKRPSWLARFRRAKTNGQSNKPADEPPTPPSREKIRAELTQTFGKMGLEMPKPPPSRRR